MKRKMNGIRETMKNPVAGCPHCRSGKDGMTLGLFWEPGERCWCCVICGYRAFADLMPTRVA
jgi:hypothetical protein